MKRKLLLLIFLFGVMLFTGAANAGQVVLAWDSNTEPDLAGYKIHYGTSSRSYNHIQVVPCTDMETCPEDNTTVIGLIPGETYYFAATAYDSYENQSDYSEEVVYTVPIPELSVEEALEQSLVSLVRKSGLGVANTVFDPVAGDYYKELSSTLSGTGTKLLTMFKIDLAPIINDSLDMIRWEVNIPPATFTTTTTSYFIVEVNTTYGIRKLKYIFNNAVPSGTAGTITCGMKTTLVGEVWQETIPNLMDGQWHTIQRNLQEDINKAQEGNHLLGIMAFYLYIYNQAADPLYFDGPTIWASQP